MTIDMKRHRLCRPHHHQRQHLGCDISVNEEEFRLVNTFDCLHSGSARGYSEGGSVDKKIVLKDSDCDFAGRITMAQNQRGKEKENESG
jgi:hypothetical protein